MPSKTSRFSEMTIQDPYPQIYNEAMAYIGKHIMIGSVGVGEYVR